MISIAPWKQCIPRATGVLHRMYSAANWNRPSPPPLPLEQQREFEHLQRTAQSSTQTSASIEADLTLHPDARKPVPPSFDGETNPITGEVGGPKQEPVGQWSEEGDWSFKGRVSDF